MYVYAVIDAGLGALLVVATALLLLRGVMMMLLLLAWALMIWVWWRTWKNVWKDTREKQGEPS